MKKLGLHTRLMERKGGLKYDPYGFQLLKFLRVSTWNSLGGGWCGAESWGWARVSYVASITGVGVGGRFTWLGDKPLLFQGEAFGTR